MKLQHHALSGGIAASLLIPVLGVTSAVFLASSVLIDGDHYLDYVYRNGFKDFSVKRCFAFHELLFDKGGKPDFLGLNIMHTIEFILLLYVVSALTDWMWLKVTLWGILFHMLFDWVYLYRQGRIFRRAFSIVEFIIRWKRLERQGLCPGLPYQSTLQAMSVKSRSSEDEVREAK